MQQVLWGKVQQQNNGNRIAIALSGGGSRAMAFHLGCLRALHQVGILQRCETLSCVSGGSVLGAMYVTHQGSFASFEANVRAQLSQGFTRQTIATAFTTSEGLKAILSTLILISYRLLYLCLLPIVWTIRLGAQFLGNVSIRPAESISPRRFASRTTVLERTFDQNLFNRKAMKDLDGVVPKFVAVATELRTGTAFYFTPGESGCWRFGKVNPDRIKIARAVAASAAYPLFLPALDEVFEFNRNDGSARRDRVTLTDGGVYDNLGLSPLWPDRNPSIGVDIPKPNIVIACRAGYGLRFGRPTNSLATRMAASFYTSFDRSQNAALKRLFDLKKAGKLQAIVLPYIGQADDRLANAPTDLIRREDVADYPTNFGPMTEDWIEKLSKRGEQVTLAVLRQHNPELIFQQ
ncbi:patatin-like phospholipase family protein [Tateyamaria sp. SN3-11]|uniref:patatin-like phospholipase family protein n=1 Tax=Tateyamaria sp. SN3-11 TaxID=3092147 RepID=UPI0039EAE2B0